MSQENWKKTFAFIWTGQLVSTLTSSIVSYAVIFWLSIQTGSASVLAYATLASLLPQLVLGFFTGVLVDRWNRKRIMIVADLYIAAITVVMAALFYTGKAELGFIYALLALRSFGSAFHVPAMEASVPMLAPKEKLMQVAGINNMLFSVSTIAAPAIAAVFVSTLDMTWVLLQDVLGALIACGSLLFVDIPNPRNVRTAPAGPEDAGPSSEISLPTSQLKMEFRRFFAEFHQGIREVQKRPGIMWMFIFTIFASLAMVPVSTLFPLMTLDHFGGDTYKMSLIEITWGIGMLVGGGLMSIPKFKFNNVMLINVMYIILGLSFAFSGFLPPQGYYYFVVFSFIGGIAAAIFWGAFTVLLQTSLDPGVLGRVFSFQGSLIMIPAMFSLVATGYIADTIGITNAFIIGGTALILIGSLSPLIPSVRKISK